MSDILGDKPDIEPLVTCSSSGDITIKRPADDDIKPKKVV